MRGAVLLELENALKTGVKPATGSQTAFLGRQGLYTGGFILNPGLAIQVILGDLALSKLFQSPLVKKLMTSGVDVSVPKLNLSGIKPPKVSPYSLTPAPPVLSQIPNQ